MRLRLGFCFLCFAAAATAAAATAAIVATAGLGWLPAGFALIALVHILVLVSVIIVARGRSTLRAGSPMWMHEG
jgi:hypothetical protein